MPAPEEVSPEAASPDDASTRAARSDRTVLDARDISRALISICAAGGQGVVAILER